MTAPLTKKQLLNQLLHAADEGGWNALIASGAHPYLLRVFRDDDRSFNLRVYIWNCTHGGHSRADDEFRIQVTIPTLEARPGETTLLLGWHSGYGVFVGFDITKHAGAVAASPSIQVREDALASAHRHSFAVHLRNNGEIAVAFRPEFLVDYALNAKALHATGTVDQDVNLLNTLDSVTDADVNAVINKDRKSVISQIVRRYRAHDFRNRVLSAYGYRCAACGVQLELIDAAHIIPVAEPSSTDETQNGVAFCKLHHAAFDRNLISFDPQYRIEVSDRQVGRLADANLIGGLRQFQRHLRDAIILPADHRDYPNPDYIKQSRVVRQWGA
ncbi:MAG: HNH endonuclease [Xanthomonadaceae bacterium]|nr:HNH endonuclease [Xanthomonadaceae bacterium]